MVGGAREAYAYPLTIGDILDSAVAARSGNVIVGTDGSRRSYPDFAERVACIASALTRLGIRPGDVVAVMDWDSHRYLELFFAVPMIGAVLQTVNVRLSPAHLDHVIEQTAPRLLLVHDDFIDLLAALTYRPPLGAIMLADTPAAIDGLVTGAMNEYEMLIASGDPQFRFPTVPETAVATTFHTSGTTGLPKPVAFSNRQLVLHTLATTAMLALQPSGQNLTRDDVYMPITPMFHVHAWGVPYVATMLGLKQVYPGRYQADRLIALQRDEGVSFSHGVPTIVTMLLDALDDGELRGRWKMVVGGSALPGATHARAAAKGMDIIVGYGMSETAPLVSLSRHADRNGADAADMLCRAGRALPLVKLRTIDAAGEDTPTGERGELVVRSPWLTQGYGDDQSASDALWSGGWLHTGDIATVDASGVLTIVDRLKDVIKTGGEWVSSIEIENLLLRHPAIAEAAVIGIPHAHWGERPLAFVVRVDDSVGDATLREHLAAFVRSGELSRYALPETIVFRDTLPRTGVGKIDKRSLRDTLTG